MTTAPLAVGGSYQQQSPSGRPRRRRRCARAIARVALDAVPPLAAGRWERPGGDVARGEPDPARVLPRRRRDDRDRRGHAEHGVPGRASLERRLHLVRDAHRGRRAGVRLFGGASDVHPRGAAEPAEREHREPVLGVPGDRGGAAAGGPGVRLAHEQRGDLRQHRRSPVPGHALRRGGRDPARADPRDRRERQPDRRREVAADAAGRPPEPGRRAEHVLRGDPLRLRRAPAPVPGPAPGPAPVPDGRERPGAAGDGAAREPLRLPGQRRGGPGGQPDRRVRRPAEPDRRQPLGDADAGARLRRPSARLDAGRGPGPELQPAHRAACIPASGSLSGPRPTAGRGCSGTPSAGGSWARRSCSTSTRRWTTWSPSCAARTARSTPRCARPA